MEGLILGGVIVLFWVFLYVLLNYIRIRNALRTVIHPQRGTKSERKLVLRLLKYGIPSEMIFHDLYVKKSNGDFSQIDIVVVTEVGIIVFEVKDYSGWIFGNGFHSQWTKVLPYGKKKYRFYNPIKQNTYHISALRKLINPWENNIPFHSVIVFDGDCTIKNVTFIPEGTYLIKPYRLPHVLDIICKNNIPIEYISKERIIEVLQKAVQNGGEVEIQNQHIRNVKNKLGTHRVFD